ncbi:30S ribosomal protein S2 [Candidatus Peregrinibacteria bacterium]|nr:30S ribosomal protein S2 [Candidatus Peregrinibacteria bacterium]
MPVEQDVKLMFEKAIHIGHRTHKWNPRMKRFIYGEKDGIHIIDLEKTSKCLQAALDFLSKIAKEGKVILFVSTKPQAITMLEKAALECKMPYVVGKWIPGLLTNFSTIKTRIKYLTDLKERKERGDFDKYTKKEASKLTKEINKLQIALGGVEDMTVKPDAVFVLDVVRDNIVVEEASKLGIPIVGVVDTNSDPSNVDYPIPGNDDAVNALSFYIEKVVDAVKSSVSKSKK